MRHCIDRHGWIRLKRDEKDYQKMQSDRASELGRIRRQMVKYRYSPEGFLLYTSTVNGTECFKGTLHDKKQICAYLCQHILSNDHLIPRINI